MIFPTGFSHEKARSDRGYGRVFIAPIGAREIRVEASIFSCLFVAKNSEAWNELRLCVIPHLAKSKMLQIDS